MVTPRFDHQLTDRSHEFQPRRNLTYAEFVSGSFDSTNLEYQPTDWPDTEEVAEVLKLEGEVLADLDRNAASPADWERAASEDYADFAHDHDWPPLDLGVVGVVRALAETGFVPSTSCRGHVGGVRDVPHVRFFTNAERFDLLRPLANGTVTFHPVEPGLVEAISVDVRDLHALALNLHNNRSLFAGLPCLIDEPASDDA